jgi:hypothetical protein
VVESLKRALSWLVVFAVGLAPMLVYWVAGLIRQAFRRKRGGPRADGAPVHTEGEARSTGARRVRQTNSDPRRRFAATLIIWKLCGSY